MMITGVQPVGSRSIGGVQAGVVDTKETTRPGTITPTRGDGNGQGNVRPGDPQPVVFPREGMGLDQRPVALRQEHAANRYRDDGGDERGGSDRDGDESGEQRG